MTLYSKYRDDHPLCRRTAESLKGRARILETERILEAVSSLETGGLDTFDTAEVLIVDGNLLQYVIKYNLVW